MKRAKLSTMPSPPDREPLTAMVNELPFPIAYPLERLLAQSDSDEGCARWAEVTFQAALRYICVLLLAEYSRYPGQDNEIDLRIKNLERPSTGKHMEFVRDVAKRLYELGHLWIVTDLPAELHFLRSARGPRPG